MPDDDVTNQPREPTRLEGVLAEYLHAVEAGGKPNRDELLAKHPDLADDLREFFTNHDRMEQLARPAGSPVPAYDQSTLIRPEADKVGLSIGPYTLLQKLGEGGGGGLGECGWRSSPSRSSAGWHSS
jgi:hypothetical protein